MFLAQVPFKTNGESLVFHDDHVEFKGQSLRYDQIESLVMDGRWDFEAGHMPAGSGFTGFVTFSMRDGGRHKVVINETTIFGISVILGNPRNSHELFVPLFEAVYSILAKSVAQRFIHAIRQGQTVEVAGLLISETVAVRKGESPGVPGTIIKANYQKCQINDYGSGVTVFGKMGETLWISPVWNYTNVILIPHILDAIFGSK